MLLLIGCVVRGPHAEPETGQDTDAVEATACGLADGSVGTATCGEVQTCEAPAASVTYTEVGGAWGLQGAADPDNGMPSGGGMAIDDLDRDGDLDLVVSYAQHSMQFYWQDAGTYTLEELTTSLGTAPSLVDVDGDGWTDLTFGGIGMVMGNHEGSFREDEILGELGDTLFVEMAPVDLDGDGRQDLYGVITDFTEEDGTDRFFWNRGELEFDQDDDLLEGGLPSGQGFDAVVFDVDGDTWLDVYVVNDMGEQHGPNALLRNTGGGLEDASDACACGLAMSGMGASVGDYDRDGLPDLYVTATSHNLLLQGQDDGTFVDVSNAMGADPVVDVIDMGWGSAMVDHDNDGDLDIVTAQGDFAFDHASGVSLPINLLSQQDGSFVDLGAELGLQQEGLHRAVIPIDWNEDGVLDLVISQAVERPLVYLSDSCTANAWLAVEAPIGSKVVVTAGDEAWSSWVVQDPGFGGARRPEAWFGLGALDEVDSVHVTFASEAGVLEVTGPLATRRRLVVSGP